MKNFCSQINCDVVIMVWSRTYHSFSVSRHCLFEVNPSIMLGSKIEVCKPPRNNLQSCQRHRNDAFVWNIRLNYWPSATKLIYMGKWAVPTGAILFSGFRKAPDVQIFQGLRLLPMRHLKKVEQERSTRGPRDTCQWCGGTFFLRGPCLRGGRSRAFLLKK